jgi:GNAT superfamily N-acetyltransferase
MEVSSDPLNLSQLSHDDQVETLKFKFEVENPDSKFSIGYFSDLSQETKTSRLMFYCGNSGIDHFVHRGLWPMTERRKIESVTITSQDGIHAVMSYAVAPLYSKALRQKLNASSKDKIIFLKYLAVDKLYQRQEMGMMLLHMLIDLGREMAEEDNSYKYITLEASTQEACDFYESHGFEKIDRKANGDSQYVFSL